MTWKKLMYRAFALPATGSRVLCWRCGMFRTVRTRPDSCAGSSSEACPDRRPDHGPPEGRPSGTRPCQHDGPGGGPAHDRGMPDELLIHVRAHLQRQQQRHQGRGDAGRRRRAALPRLPAGALPQGRPAGQHQELRHDQGRTDGPAGRGGGCRVRRLRGHVLRAGAVAGPGQGAQLQEQPEPGDCGGRVRRGGEHDGGPRPAAGTGRAGHRHPAGPGGQDGRDGSGPGDAE